MKLKAKLFYKYTNSNRVSQRNVNEIVDDINKWKEENKIDIKYITQSETKNWEYGYKMAAMAGGYVSYTVWYEEGV